MTIWAVEDSKGAETPEQAAIRKLRETVRLNGVLASTALKAAEGDVDRAVSILETAIMTLRTDSPRDLGQWDG